MSDVKQTPISIALMSIQPTVTATATEPESVHVQSGIEQSIAALEAATKEIEAKLEFLAGFEKTLADAFDQEIDLLHEASSVTKNDAQRRIFSIASSSLRRIKNRWTIGKKYRIDTENMVVDEYQ